MKLQELHEGMNEAKEQKLFVEWQLGIGYERNDRDRDGTTTIQVSCKDDAEAQAVLAAAKKLEDGFDEKFDDWCYHMAQNAFDGTYIPGSTCHESEPKITTTNTRPWERGAHDLSSLGVVQSIEGGKNKSTLHWIPGVVLAAVGSDERIDCALEDLSDALGRSGSTFGVLLLMPGIRWLKRPDAATLARRRIRVMIADSNEIDPHHPEEDRLNELGRRSLEKIGRGSFGRINQRISALRGEERCQGVRHSSCLIPVTSGDD